MGLLGLLVHHVGEVKRGTQMVEAAMQLNPHYPPVFRAPAFLNAYAEGKYAEALELAVRFNMPGFFHAHALRAAALGQLGQREAVSKRFRNCWPYVPISPLQCAATTANGGTPKRLITCSKACAKPGWRFPTPIPNRPRRKRTRAAEPQSDSRLLTTWASVTGVIKMLLSGSVPIQSNSIIPL
jgi:hypothetical protein